MFTPSFDTQIDLLEAQFQDVSTALMGGDPAAMQSSFAAFQRLTIELVQMADGVERNQLRSPSRMRKIRALASGMVILRENLVCQSAYVERALEVLVPATRQKSTYAGSGVYGSSIRRSGEFAAFAA
nr:hypothetical protein [Rhodoferax sp.]